MLQICVNFQFNDLKVYLKGREKVGQKCLKHNYVYYMHFLSRLRIKKRTLAPLTVHMSVSYVTVLQVFFFYMRENYETFMLAALGLYNVAHLSFTNI